MRSLRVFHVENSTFKPTTHDNWAAIGRFSFASDPFNFHGALLIRHATGELDVRLPRASVANYASIAPGPLKNELIDIVMRALGVLSPALPSEVAA